MEGSQKSNGALLGSIIIIIILVLGGIYFWQTSLKEKAYPANSPMSEIDPASMEANLNNVDVENTDSGI